MSTTAPKYSPMLFAGPMVLAILEDRKWMTRRIITGDAEYHACVTGDCPHLLAKECEPELKTICRYGGVGDRIYGRETLHEVQGKWYYSADGAPVTLDAHHPSVAAMAAWAHHRERPTCPSILMPRWASRITLEITSLGADIVRGISEEDAIAEGFTPSSVGRIQSAREAFLELFFDVNKKQVKKDAHPRVFVIGFRKIAA